ncbi:MAG: VWA domain-containing protein [Planctomycetes bacterium]|nr:VWA domain-containing protein [Planctomycetota bacterium]
MKNTSSPLSASSVRWSAATLGLLGVALGFNYVRDANARPTPPSGPDCVLPVQQTPTVAVVHPNGNASAGGISLDAALSQAQLQRGADGELYLHCGVTVREDAGAEAPRRPLNLALVLDTSGSMQNSMGLLREATLGAVDRLGPNDRLTIVAYSSSARLVYSGFPAQTGRAAMAELVNGLQAGGNTNLSAGIELAAQQLVSSSGSPGCRIPLERGCREPVEDCEAPQRAPQAAFVQRMLVLTDGLANLGVTDPAGLRTMITRVRSKGSAVSSLGLGAEFNEELLGGLADSGGGAYHYVSEPAALDAVYAAEVEAMQGLVAKRAELVIRAQDGTVLDEVFSWPSEQNPDARTVAIGDLSRGRSLKVMARIHVGTAGPQAALDTLQVSLRYTDPDSGALRTLDPIALSVGVTDSADEARASVDAALTADLAKVRVARQLDQARAAAKAGRYEEAQQLARDCKEIVGTDSMSYDAPAGAPCEVDFDELADGLAEGESSERGRRALKQSHAAELGASR